MSSRLDMLLGAYKDTTEKSRRICHNEISKLEKYTLKVAAHFYETEKKHQKTIGSRLSHSLVNVCVMESWRVENTILFFACNGLYRNAFDCIRHMLESIVQALYIDIRHKNSDLSVKIEILKEVEDKTEYHAVRLIDELELDFKDKLKSEYKRLSKIVHPSHEQIVTTIRDVNEANYPLKIDCSQISKIYDSMIIMNDIFYFLYLKYFPEFIQPLGESKDFLEDVKEYKLVLLSKVFRVKL